MSSPDVIIIRNPEDDLADAVAQALPSHGKTPVQLSVAEGASAFTVWSDHSGGRVEPDRPLLLRPFSGTGYRPGEDGSARFHYAERLGLLWAAGALMRSAVINRPGPYGFSGKCRPAASLTALECGEFDGRLEVFFRGDPAQYASFGGLVEDLQQFRFVDAAEAPHGIYRARDGCRIAGYYPVAVVGEKAFPCLRGREAPPRTLELSVEATAKLGLRLSLLFWGVVEENPFLASVVPWPNLWQLGEQRDLVVDEIAEILSK